LIKYPDEKKCINNADFAGTTSMAVFDVKSALKKSCTDDARNPLTAK